MCHGIFFDALCISRDTFPILRDTHIAARKHEKEVVWSAGNEKRDPFSNAFVKTKILFSSVLNW